MITSLSVLSPREDVIGLEIGDGLAVAARVKVDRHGRLRLQEAGHTQYNSKGSADDIAASLLRMWREAKLSRFTVASSLRSRSVVLKRFQYPAMATEELESALQLEAEESLQSSHAEVVLDWHVNPSDSGLNSRAGEALIDGTLVAAPRREVNSRIQILRKATLFPVAMDVSCFALANLFRASMSSEDNEGVVGLVRCGAQSADIAILYGQSSIYPRSVFVSATRDSDPVHYYCEAIKDVLAYYRFKLHLPEIKQFYITGMSDDDTLQRMNDALDVSVQRWDPTSALHSVSRQAKKFIDGADPAVLGGLAIAMGLALRGE